MEKLTNGALVTPIPGAHYFDELTVIQWEIMSNVPALDLQKINWVFDNFHQ